MSLSSRCNLEHIFIVWFYLSLKLCNSHRSDRYLIERRWIHVSVIHCSKSFCGNIFKTESICWMLCGWVGISERLKQVVGFENFWTVIFWRVKTFKSNLLIKIYSLHQETTNAGFWKFNETLLWNFKCFKLFRLFQIKSVIIDKKPKTCWFISKVNLAFENPS